MDQLNHLATQFLNRPLLLLPSQLASLATVLDRGLGETAAAQMTPIPNASRFVGSSTARDPATGSGAGLPYRRTAEGVAIIPVLGTTLNRGTWLGSYYGFTSYEGLKYQLAHAAADTGTRSVILDMESPGGAAIGCFEAAEAVRQLAAKKPVVAVVNGMAASAAYAIASAATRIVTTPSGISGSIGVVMLHADYSGALRQAGVKPTLIYAGAHKVDGNPYEPLPDGVRDDLKAEIEQLYGAFVGCVAAGRTNLSAAAVRATEARTFIGAGAVSAGLADAVGTFESVLADLSAGRIGTRAAQSRPTGQAPESPRVAADRPIAEASRATPSGLNASAIYAARRSGPAEPSPPERPGARSQTHRAGSGVQAGIDHATVYAGRRDTPEAVTPASQAARPASGTRPGVKTSAIYAARRADAQAADAQAGTDPDAATSRGRATGSPDPAVVYAARRTQETTP